MIRQSAAQSSDGIIPQSTQNQSQNVLPEVIFTKDDQARVYVGKNGASAFPKKQKSFIKMIPFCLWVSFRQPYIIYYLCASVLQYFKFCSLFNIQLFDLCVYSFLIIVCIIFQMGSRYKTYQNYANGLLQEYINTYPVWNQQNKQWEDITMRDLKQGQLIKVEKYFDSNNKRNPTNILPLFLASNGKNLLIMTTRIDKREQYTKVKLFKQLRQLVSLNSKNQCEFSDKIFNISLQYRFVSQLGSTFEAVLSFGDDPNSEILISRQNIIPCGIPISTEDYVIGIVLRHTQNFKTNNILSVLTKLNKINQILNKYLLFAIFINVFIIVCVLIINFLLTNFTTNITTDLYGEYFYCLVMNLLSNFCNVIYIAMNLMIYIHRLMDNDIIHKKNKTTIKNTINSFDQLAQTDTLIMDDYFFLERVFNPDGFQMIFNKQAPMNNRFHLLLKLMDQSPLLKEQMSGHTVPITKYFRLHPRNNQEKKGRIKIMKQTLKSSSQSQSCIEITIKVQCGHLEERFIVRFHDNSTASILQQIRDPQLKHGVNKLILKKNQNSSLIFFLEIKKQENDSLQTSNQLWVFYGAVSFIEDFNPKALSLIKSQTLLKKYNIAIMTNRSQKYMKYFMDRGELKKRQDKIIFLEEKEEEQMNQIIRNHRKTFRQQRKQGQNKKKNILFLNSNMVTYLSRRNIRKSIFKLAIYCKYIVFFNCSQYQKQICAVNLFRIFPNHIFMSNYICDHAIFSCSNISICERGSSSQLLTTMVITRFDYLEKLIFSQAIKSIQILYCIINSHIFKNQLLLICMAVSFLILYRGNNVDIGISYISQISFFYNFVFTVIPIFFMILKRPGLYIDEDVRQYLTVAHMVASNIKTIIFGVVMTVLIYGLISEEFATNLQTTILINCVISSNVYLLLLDDSYQKKNQVIVIIIQIIFSLLLILMIQLFDSENFLFIIFGTNFYYQNIWFYLTTFLIAPLISLMALFAFSAGREIKLVQNQREIQLKEWSERFETSGESRLTEENNSEIIFKVTKSNGKQMHFVDSQSVI